MKGKGSTEEIEYPEGYIEELETIIIKENVTIKWTLKEEAVIRRYYGKVYPTSRLLKYLPGRTLNSIHDKARRIGISFQKEV